MIPIYLHNPRCSKSRQGLALLQQHNIDVTVREYLKTPLTDTELGQLFKKLGKSPQDCIRKKDAEKLNISIDGKSDDALIELIATHPILLERPILVTDKSAQVGRPPEKLLELL